MRRLTVIALLVVTLWAALVASMSASAQVRPVTPPVVIQGPIMAPTPILPPTAIRGPEPPIIFRDQNTLKVITVPPPRPEHRHQVEGHCAEQCESRCGRDMVCRRECKNPCLELFR